MKCVDSQIVALERVFSVIDKYGRSIDYMRISVTDRCNLRCTYCMPEKSISCLENEQLLTLDEIYRVANLSSQLGISKIRITGGEPLVRAGIIDLIKKFKDLENIQKVYMTTNGILLEEYVQNLHEVGLDGVNISIDSLKNDRYVDITRGGDLNKVINGVKLCIDKNIKVKINTVIIKGFNEDEIIDFVDYAKNNPVDVRFIELMPIGEANEMIGFSNEEIRKIIEKSVKLVPLTDKDEARTGPSDNYKIHEGIGKIGFISAMSSCFCKDCNRIRLTCDGFLKQCLNWNYGSDLKSLMRNGISDEELKVVIKEGIENKPLGHKFQDKSKDSDNRFMFQIGG